MQNIIDDAKSYIKIIFENDYSGHDYFHSLRVCDIARKLAEKEEADIKIVSLAALLHDVDDRKLSPQTYENKENAIKFLKCKNISESDIKKICDIIDEVSFKGNDSVVPTTKEGKCVQDADRLDALGAIGIARVFAYGGSHNRKMYDPNIFPRVGVDKVQYQNGTTTSINHFYEKLFLLKDLMNTDSARKIAERREKFMTTYIEEFMLEWNGEEEVC